MKAFEPQLLSRTGANVATAYTYANKIITHAGKTHVVWLDEILLSKARTYDHEKDEWGKTVVLGEGCDNHASPCLSMDSKGHLHVAYGPHGCWYEWNQGRVKVIKSKRPGSIDEWEVAEDVGYNASYPCLVHDERDVAFMVYRGGEFPCSVMLQHTMPKGGWSSAREIIRQDIEPQYTQYLANLLVNSQGWLYLACHLIQQQSPRTGQFHQGVMVICSKDKGENWQCLDGRPLNLPVTYGESMSIPHPKNSFICGIQLDSKDNLWGLTTAPKEHESRELLLSRWSPGGWNTEDLSKYLPKDRIPTDANLSIDARDNIHVTVDAYLRENREADLYWGNASTEIFHLSSTGQGFRCTQITETGEEMPCWLSNLSRAGVHHANDYPAFVYTHGRKSDGSGTNKPKVESDVYFVSLEEM